MAALLSGLLIVVTVVFAASSMLSVGFSHSLRDIVGPLRNVGAVFRALIANFVLVPALAYIVVKFLALDASSALGLMLIATGAGAPFLIKLTTHAGGDVARSATLLVLLLPVTVVYLPLIVPRIAPGVSVNALTIAGPLVLTMLVPLGLGLLLKARRSDWAERLRPIMAKTSSYALVSLVGLTLLSNLSRTLDVTMRAILAAMLVIGGAFAIGYALGGASSERRVVFGLGTAQRNIAAATVVATEVFRDPGITIMVIITSMVGLALLFPIAAKLRQRKAEEAKPGGRVASLDSLPTQDTEDSDEHPEDEEWLARQEPAEHSNSLRGSVGNPHGAARRRAVPGHAAPRGAGRELRSPILHRADLYAVALGDVDRRARSTYRAVGQHELRLDR